jgi:hypothetical protein
MGAWKKQPEFLVRYNDAFSPCSKAQFRGLIEMQPNTLGALSVAGDEGDLWLTLANAGFVDAIQPGFIPMFSKRYCDTHLLLLSEW